MEIFLLILGVIALLVGLAGAVLPLPGPPLSYGGMIALHYSGYAHFSKELLLILGLLTALVVILDYYVPIWGTKRFGGTKWGVIGAAIGLFIGLFFGLPGIFIGSFAGAFVGEILNGSHHDKAFKAAVGSFVGLMAGIVVKVLLCLAMIGFSVSSLYNMNF